MKYYSAIKRKARLIHATTWTDLENIMHKEIKPVPEEKMLQGSSYVRALG